LARAHAGFGRARRLTGERASARTHLAIGLDLASVRRFRPGGPASSRTLRRGA
jgi:hypothetical protein